MTLRLHPDRAHCLLCARHRQLASTVLLRPLPIGFPFTRLAACFVPQQERNRDAAADEARQHLRSRPNQFRDRSFPYPKTPLLGVACLTWWAPYTRLRRLPGTLTYGTSSTSGTIARGPSPSKSWRPSGGATGTARPCICNTSRSAAELRLRSPCCGTTRGPIARRRGAGPTRGGCQSPRSLNWRTSEAASMRHGHSISLLCLLLLCYLLLCLRRGQPCTTSRLRQRLRRPCCPSE